MHPGPGSGRTLPAQAEIAVAISASIATSIGRAAPG
jgi:hypothetical protein